MDVSEGELDVALHQVKDTTPGPNEIMCEMLRKLREEREIYLLRIFNSV